MASRTLISDLRVRRQVPDFTLPDAGESRLVTILQRFTTTNLLSLGRVEPKRGEGQSGLSKVRLCADEKSPLLADARLSHRESEASSGGALHDHRQMPLNPLGISI